MDLKPAIRSLRKTPATTGAALACIALGIGAATSIFSAVNAALLRPPPFKDPEQLVSVFRTTPHFQDGPFSAPTYLDLVTATRTLSGLVALSSNVGIVTQPSGSFRVRTAQVSAETFTVLGVAAMRGRLFGAEDGRPDAPAVAVLSFEGWRERFGADPAIVGSTIQLDGQPATVIGILPKGFRIVNAGRVHRGDLWTPLRLTPSQLAERRSNFLMLVGRLRPSSTVTTAEAELTQLMRGLIEAHPELRGEDIRVGQMTTEATRQVRQPLLLLFGAVGLVLLVAAGNVAGLLLARGTAQRRELAIRSALGASKADLARRILVESAALVTTGAVLGIGLAWIGVRVIGAMAAAQMPQLEGLAIDGRVGGFALLLGVIVCLGCGLLPAWRAGQADPFEAMQSSGGRGGSARGQHRVLRVLTAAEVAVSVVLLISCGLVVRGFLGLIRQSPGFDPTTILTTEVTVSEGRYPESQTTTQFLEPVLESIRRVPGVRDAAGISLVPYDSWGGNFNVRYEGRDQGDPTRLPLVESRLATPSLFSTLGNGLVRGRLPTDAELGPNAPTVVVANEALVARDFPGQDAVGARFRINDTSVVTIVGVVRDIRNFGPFQPPHPEVYWFYRQFGAGTTSFPLVIRTSGDPDLIKDAVVSAIRRVDPTAALGSTRPIERVISESMGRPRFFVLLLGAFAGVALVLAAAGLYGVLSYVVTRETREIGIRMALGSTPGQIVRDVMSRGGILVVGGACLGGVVALGAAGALRTLLYGVSPGDPVTWALVIATVLVTSGAAMAIPARRAAAVDPLEAIRAE